MSQPAVPAPHTPMKNFLQVLRKPWLRVLLLLAACWALAFLGPLSYLVIAAVPLALWQAWRQRTWLALALLAVLNPLSGFFIAGVAAYVDGAPVLRSPSLPDLESYNPDPVNRCPRGVEVCLVQGSEWLTLQTSNAAVRLMCRAFGPPAQAYTGPYPSKDEALALLATALLTPVDQFLQGRVLADGKMLKLQPAVVSGLAGLVGLLDDASTPVQARLYQDRCVILRLSRRAGPAGGAANPVDLGDAATNQEAAAGRMPAPRGPGIVPGASFQTTKSAKSTELDGAATDILVLIDRTKQRPFAYYPITPTLLPQAPPVTYLE